MFATAQQVSVSLSSRCLTWIVIGCHVVVMVFAHSAAAAAPYGIENGGVPAAEAAKPRVKAPGIDTRVPAERQKEESQAAIIPDHLPDPVVVPFGSTGSGNGEED